MFRSILAAMCLSIIAWSPARADPPVAAAPPEPPAAAAPDPGKASVTLTYAEIQTLVRGEVAAAIAQQAIQVAQTQAQPAIDAEQPVRDKIMHQIQPKGADGAAPPAR